MHCRAGKVDWKGRYRLHNIDIERNFFWPPTKSKKETEGGVGNTRGEVKNTRFSWLKWFQTYISMPKYASYQCRAFFSQQLIELCSVTVTVYEYTYTNTLLKSTCAWIESDKLNAKLEMEDSILMATNSSIHAELIEVMISNIKTFTICLFRRVISDIGARIFKRGIIYISYLSSAIWCYATLFVIRLTLDWNLNRTV